MRYVPVMKRQHGVYYTEDNPFALKPFRAWARTADLLSHTILEPFAGANHIPCMLEQLGLGSDFDSYDISPAAKGVIHRDTMKRFPTGYDVCVTNPPWLTNYSASRRGIPYPNIQYDNLYKRCLELALQHCQWVAFLLPATFLRTGLFRERLSDLIFIESCIFTDTDNPVCLALFGPHSTRTRVHVDDKCIGYLHTLEKRRDSMCGERHMSLRFNKPDGQLGLYGVDNTREPSIRFCRGDQVRRAKPSDRLITRIGGDFTNINGIVENLNDALTKFRDVTHDIFLAPFKGLRADGRYRRRLDYRTARGLIQLYG